MGARDAISKFSHKTDLRESRDEMFVGELVRAMARRGHRSDEFAATGDFRRVRFRVSDDLLSYVHVALDRRTRSTLVLAGEVRNDVADPIPPGPQTSSEGVEVIHELNSVIGRTTDTVNIDDYLVPGGAGVEPLTALIEERIDRVKAALRPYRKVTT